MGLVDTKTLHQVRQALAKPFADPVSVGGLVMSRRVARSLERSLLRGGGDG